jgi:hypothetical protein
MKNRGYQPMVVERKLPDLPIAIVPPGVVEVPFPACLQGPHKAEVLHQGSSYCRACLTEKLRLGR